VLWRVSVTGFIEFGQIKLQGGVKYIPLTNLEFHLILPITNPTDTNFPFKAITGAAYYGKTKIADIQLDTSETLVLRTGKTTNVPLRVSVDILKAGSDIFNLIRSGNWLDKAVVKGVVKSDLSFPFESKIF
jgi:hypothetical protein